MQKKSPYDVIKSRYITEKARVMEQLQYKASNRSIQKCDAPKFVFLVDKRANKQEIAEAVEEIYASKKIKVARVNTLNCKSKMRRVRGRAGFTSGFKKAIVTLEPGDTIDEQA